MNIRPLLICSALLLLFAHGANAGGAYQRTKDGKTRVWNNRPLPGDAATWSGQRDADGYATGYGTLTWYTTERKKVTGSNLPSAKYTVISLYSGNMVRGKLEGAVENVSGHGKIFHATFADGHKASDWVTGPATPTPGPSAPKAEPIQPESGTGIALEHQPSPGPGATGQPNEPIKQETVIEPPAEGPRAAPASTPQPPQNVSATKQPKPSVSTSSVIERPSPTIDDSLRSLIGPSPASSPETNVAAEASPPPVTSTSPPPPPAASPPPVTSTSSPPPPPPGGPRLTEKEVIELANAEAHKQGYNPGEYQRPQTDFIAADDTWSVSYHQMYADGASKHFTVTVEDKTKKTSLAAGR